jgi:hypothetical protein
MRQKNPGEGCSPHATGGDYTSERSNVSGAASPPAAGGGRSPNWSSIMLKTTKKPTLEALEYRSVPAVLFYTAEDGTWAHNSDTGNYRQIETNKAVEITEGADGILYGTWTTGGSWNVGTWRYNYWTGGWSKLTEAVATDLDAANDNTLFGSFSSGIWRYNGGWQLMNNTPASELAAVDSDTFFASFASHNNLWRYDQGNWLWLTSVAPEEMAASTDGTLMTYLNGYGTYAWTPYEGWRLLTNAYANSIAGKVGNKVIATYGNGIFAYDLTTGGWEHLDSRYASQVALGQSGTLSGNLFASFAPSQGGHTVYLPYGGGWGNWVPLDVDGYYADPEQMAD